MLLGLGEGRERVATLPYQMSGRTDGLHICFPEKTVQPNYIITAFLDNVILGASSGLSRHQVVSFDDLSVTLR